MQTIILTKQHPSIQLAHLYEHLFVMAVNDMFASHSLYKSLDYYLNGTAYDASGIIEIECGAHTELAAQLLPGIPNIQIDLGEDNINVTRALMQIAAEEDYALTITDKVAVLQELDDLAHTTWIPIDELELAGDASASESGIIYLTDTRQPAAKKITLSLSLAKKNVLGQDELLPLFNVLARLYAYAVSDRISKQYGYYTGELRGRHTRTRSFVTIDFLVAQELQDSIDLEVMRDHIRTAIQNVSARVTLARLVSELRSINYQSKPTHAPDIQRIMNETEVYIGSKAWSCIATIENIDSISSRIDISIHFGDTTIPV